MSHALSRGSYYRDQIVNQVEKGERDALEAVRVLAGIATEADIADAFGLDIDEDEGEDTDEAEETLDDEE